MNDAEETIVKLEAQYAVYLKNQEQTMTEHNHLIAQILMVTEQLHQHNEITEVLIQKFFEERKHLRQYNEQVLKKAIFSGDVELADCVIQFIEKIYKKKVFEKLDKLV